MAPFFTGSKFGFGRSAASEAVRFIATAISGGSVFTPGDGYRYHVFNGPGSILVSGTANPQVEVAMVGGGGNGGTPTGNPGIPNVHDSGSGGGGGGAFVYFNLVELRPPTITEAVTYNIELGGSNSPTSFASPSVLITAGGGAGGGNSSTSDVPGGAGGTVSNPSNISTIRSHSGTNGGATISADQAGHGGPSGHTSNRSGEWWIPYMGPGEGGLGNFPSGTPGTPGTPYGGGGGGGAGQGGDNVPGIGSGGAGTSGRIVIRYAYSES
jgi:hypothetical protein